MLWRYNFILDVWELIGEVKVIKETPNAIKIKRLGKSRWIPKDGGYKIEFIGGKDE